jgi:hypothetical protein
MIPRPHGCLVRGPRPGPRKPHDIAIAPTTRAREDGAAADSRDLDDDELGGPTMNSLLAPAAIPIVDG